MGGSGGDGSRFSLDPVKLLVETVQEKFGTNDRFDDHAGVEGDGVDRLQVGRVGHGEGKAAFFGFDGDDAVTGGHLYWNQGGNLWGDGENLLLVDEGDPQLVPQDQGKFMFGDEAELHQIRPEFSPVNDLVPERLVELLGGYSTCFQQDLTEFERHDSLPSPDGSHRSTLFSSARTGET
ncbi:MAG: hypothetical protein Fur0034_03740 [Desulfuromonadia bacterium]